MSKFPVFLIENHIKYKLLLSLIVISKLSETDKGELKININRLKCYIYLLTNPLIFLKILRLYKQKKKIQFPKLIDIEKQSLGFNKISTRDIVLNDEVKDLLGYAYMYGLLKLDMINTEFFYKLSDYGNEIIANTTDEFVDRIKYLADFLQQLQVYDDNQILKNIIREVDVYNE